MTTWQPQQSFRPESQSNIALGVLIALAVVGAAIAFMTVLDRRPGEAELGAAVTELRAVEAELKASAATMREAAAALQTATHDLERRGPTINVLDLPPPGSPAQPTPVVVVRGDIPIHCVEEGRCRISRAFVDQLLADPRDLATQARIMPSVKDGEARGFKIYGIRPGSLPKLLGLKNGDLITAINGISLTSTHSALSAYPQLRAAREFKLAIERRGEPVALHLTIE